VASPRPHTFITSVFRTMPKEATKKSHTTPESRKNSSEAPQKKTSSTASMEKARGHQVDTDRRR